MDIEAVLKRYAAGERNFSQLNFQEAELTNLTLNAANFSHADFR
jgi:uncharacterized protein YjbI with pentapeptide repeats